MNMDWFKQAVEMIDMDSPVRIKCNEHDLWFLVSPHDHLNYSHGGCPACKLAEAEAVRH